jgi:predicted outer membrane repeat protein
LPVIAANNNLTIVGNGDTIQRKSSAAFRFFEVAGGASLALNDVTLQNGSVGGIYNAGTLTVSNATISGNSGGPAIENHGTLTVSNTTIKFNSGGGIFNAGTATVQSSTLSNNSTGYFGGGIYNAGTLTVSASTVSHNTSASGGGGIYTSGPVEILNQSIVCNNDCTGPLGKLADDVYVSGPGGSLHGDGTSTVCSVYSPR